MKRSTFLTIAAVIPMAIGVFALTCPAVLIETVKVAAPSGAANAMARTVGILIFSSGILNFMVRNDEDSDTLRSVLIGNLVLQLGIMPLDPIAYWMGAFNTVGSFAPNTIIHVCLAFGFAYYLVKMKKKTSHSVPEIASAAFASKATD